MTLATLTAAVAAGLDTKTLFSIRAPKLVIGQNYVMTAWTGKEKTARAVSFIGAGAAPDDLAEKNPRIKDMTEGQFYFFVAETEDGKDETIAAFGHDGMLCIGVPQTKDSVETSIPTRVTFFSETAPVKAAPAPKAPKASKTTSTPAADAEPSESATSTEEVAENPAELEAAEEVSAKAEDSELVEVVEAETGVADEATEA